MDERGKRRTSGWAAAMVGLLMAPASAEGGAPHVERKVEVDARLAEVVATLPRFTLLPIEQRPDFVGPPHPGREASAGDAGGHVDLLTLADEPLAFANMPTLTELLPERWDAPELIGTARPGVSTFLRQLGGNGRITVDLGGACLDQDPYLRSLDRRQGISFRDPGAWP